MDSLGKKNKLLIGNARHPYWFHNDKKLLFTRNHEVYIFDIKTHAEKQLTHLTSKSIQAKMPSISPDEQKLAFIGYDDNGKSAMYIINLNKEEIPLRIEDCQKPNWTSDPKYLVTSCRSGPGKPWQIVMLNAVTGEKTFILDENRNNYDPCWVNNTK